MSWQGCPAGPLPSQRWQVAEPCEQKRWAGALSPGPGRADTVCEWSDPRKRAGAVSPRSLLASDSRTPLGGRGADPGEPAPAHLSAGSPPPFHLPPRLYKQICRRIWKLIGCVKRVLTKHQALVAGSWGNGLLGDLQSVKHH